MSKRFLCPKCRGRLDVHEYVAFTAKSKNGNMGLLLLSPHLDNFDVWHNDSFSYNKGELIKFFCPLCHTNLTANEMHEHLVQIHMIDEEEEEHNVLFSGVAGEQATYCVRDNKMEHYGNNAYLYMDYFQFKL